MKDTFVGTAVDHEYEISVKAYLTNGICRVRVTMPNHKGERQVFSRSVHHLPEAKQIRLRHLMQEAEEQARAYRDYALQRRHDTQIMDLLYAFLIIRYSRKTCFFWDKYPGQRYSFERRWLPDAVDAERHLLGIPFFDCESLPDRTAESVLPLIPASPEATDPPPWNELTTAPLPVLAACCAAIGAQIYDCPLDMEGLKQVETLERFERLRAGYAQPRFSTVTKLNNLNAKQPNGGKANASL